MKKQVGYKRKAVGGYAGEISVEEGKVSEDSDDPCESDHQGQAYLVTFAGGVMRNDPLPGHGLVERQDDEHVEKDDDEHGDEVSQKAVHQYQSIQVTRDASFQQVPRLVGRVLPTCRQEVLVVLEDINEMTTMTTM